MEGGGIKFKQAREAEPRHLERAKLAFDLKYTSPKKAENSDVLKM